MKKLKTKKKTEGEPEELFIIDFGNLLIRQIKIIIYIPLLSTLLVIIYLLFFTSPLYRSSAKIISSNNTSNSESMLTNIASSFGVQIPNSSNKQEWVYPEIVKSRTIAKAMLRRTFQTEELGSNRTLSDILMKSKSTDSEPSNSLKVQSIQKFIDMINIDKNGQFYDLTISTFEPKLAKDLIDALIEELGRHQKKITSKQIKETRLFIEERLNMTFKELTVIEDKLKDFRQRNRRIENSPLLQLEQQRLIRDMSVITGVYTTLKQQLETTKIEEVKKKEYIIVLDEPEIPISPFQPQKRRIASLTLLFSTFGAFCIAFFIDFLQNLDSLVILKLKNLKSSFMRIFLR